MGELQNYDSAVEVIKTAILQSQYDAARAVNEKQLILYYGVGKYISRNSREGFWGKGAIETISEQLSKELPGLRGFSARNLRYMRMFYEEWADLDTSPSSPLIELSSDLALTSAKSVAGIDAEIWHLQVPKPDSFPVSEFFSVGFTQHRTIFEKVKDRQERCFYIRLCAEQKYTVEELRKSITRDDYHHQGNLPNNFMRTMSAGQQALKAISTFRDEYLLDYINVEELNIPDIVPHKIFGVHYNSLYSFIILHMWVGRVKSPASDCLSDILDIPAQFKTIVSLVVSGEAAQ